jgi:transcriptional regulator with XRE-family HTH domain
VFNKNLKYFRLKKELTKKELADKIAVTPMAITHYESGARKPDMAVIKQLAAVLGVRVADFLAVRNENLAFSHGDFRKNSTLTATQQEYVRECVEEYFNRFMTIVEILGGEVLPDAPETNNLHLFEDNEANAQALRKHLGLAADGPIGSLVELLENKGILVYMCAIENDKFSGMNGFINDRPYIVINETMSPERNRSTIVHELARLMFAWPTEIEDKQVEATAAAIGGAFLFHGADAVRELGIRRSRWSSDMLLVAKEYGISMLLLMKRARLLRIVSESTETDFFIWASGAGWRKNEPPRIERERPSLFEQLVFRAVNENDISMQRGAELLKVPYDELSSRCSLLEAR